MKIFLRPFTELVTDLTPRIFDSVFEKTRIRLTLIYAGITMLIIAVFSGALYSSLEKNMANIIARDMGRSRESFEIFRGAAHELELLIIQMDIALVFLITIISYILAGRVLRPIREAVASQERFMADASHDLRTPLSIMKTEIEVNMGDKDKYEKVLKSNLEEINKMSLLVTDLLTLGRSSDSENKKNMIEVEMQDFLSELLLRFESVIKTKGLEFEFTNEIKAKVKIDKLLFARAIENIIQNSINYTESGSIKIFTEKNKKIFVINILDTGVGINSQDMPFIFDRFYKAENSRKDNSSSGLGLSIVKKIITDHKGNINIKSKVGEGTLVAVSLGCA